MFQLCSQTYRTSARTLLDCAEMPVEPNAALVPNFAVKAMVDKWVKAQQAAAECSMAAGSSAAGNQTAGSSGSVGGLAISNAPKDLRQLQALLVSAPPGSVIDLGGRRLGGLLPDPALTLSTKNLTLSNGALSLPAGAFLSVTGAGIMLSNIQLQGTGRGGRRDGMQLPALVAVSGQGADAHLKECDIELTVQDEAGSGILITSGASAHLEDARVHSRYDSTSESSQQPAGVLVCGKGSSAQIERCTVSGCADGFAAAHGGRLAAAQCTASSNRGAGFSAHHGGRLVAGAACTAHNNWHGFLASGHGASLEVRERCVASENKADGFYVQGGAGLHVGEGCAAVENSQGGFVAECRGSVLAAARGCKAQGNAGHGWLAVDGAQLQAGPSAQALANGCSGFQSRGEGSQIVVREHSVAAENQGGRVCGPVWRPPHSERGMWCSEERAAGFPGM